MFCMVVSTRLGVDEKTTIEFYFEALLRFDDVTTMISRIYDPSVSDEKTMGEFLLFHHRFFNWFILSAQ